MATETEKAWAAGFFDGEGCVNIRINPNRRWHTLTIILAQKDRRPLARFQEIFGNQEKIGITWKRPYYRLTLCGTRAGAVLREMWPYLVLKREVAAVGIQLQESLEQFSRRDRAKGALTPAVIGHRHELAEQVKWFNTGRWAAAETKPEDVS